MVLKRIMIVSLAWLMAAGSLPALAQQAAEAGTIAGRAAAEARRPYTNYVVQLRDIDTGQIVLTTSLDDRGRYEFADVPLDRQLLIELYDTSRREMVCTEGPQRLTRDTNRKLDMDIDCGAAPAAAWLVAAAAGAVAAVGVATQSPSR